MLSQPLRQYVISRARIGSAMPQQAKNLAAGVRRCMAQETESGVKSTMNSA